MSRTFKHEPYWVLLNRYGIEDHNHTFSGRWGSPRYRQGRALRDDKGNLIMEDVPVYRRASWIAEFVPRTKTYLTEVTWPVSVRDSMFYTSSNGRLLTTVTGRGVNPLWQEAQRLVNDGKGDTQMVYETVKRPKRLMHEIHVAQHCTADLPMDRHNRTFLEHPCTPRMPRDFNYKGRKPGWQKAQEKADHSSRRARHHANGRRLAAAYNSGNDLDEYEFERDMTEITSGWTTDRW